MMTQKKTFGQLFKEERVKHKKTLSEVGEHVGKATSYLSDIEHGRKGAPDLETVKQIEEFLLITDGRLVQSAAAERWKLPRNVMRQVQDRRVLADLLMRAEEISDEAFNEFLDKNLERKDAK